MRVGLVWLLVLSSIAHADEASPLFSDAEPVTVDAPWIVEDQPRRWPGWFDGGTLNLSPTAVYESGFGITGGAQLVHRDLFGAAEQLVLRAGFGGRTSQAYGLELRSGQRFSRFRLALGTSYERRHDEPSYGIGDDADAEMRFRDDVFRSAATIDIPFTPELGDALKTRLATAYVHHDLMSERFASLRFEGALVLDTRSPSASATRALDATGWYANLHAGMSRDLASDLYWFSSYGGELQRYFDLYRGRHVFAVRVMFETIEEGEPRFVDLPQLGGTELLRGYPSGRFRDRALTLATAEYTWCFGDAFAAYTFVDAGRVWPSLSDVTLDRGHVGYGLGLQLHTAERFLGRVQAAASRDGDFVLELVFAPADHRPRRE